MTEEKPAEQVKETVAQPQPPEAKTFTQEEMDTEFKNRYKNIQRELAKRETEIKKLSSQIQPTSNRDKITRQLIEEVKPDALPEWDKDVQYTQWQREVDSRKTKMEDQILAAGLNPDDEQFESVFDLFETAALSGRFERAEKKLERTLGKLKQATPKVEGKELDTLVDERARKILEDKGQLVTESSLPSGANRRWTSAEIERIAEQQDGWKTLEKEFGKNFAVEITNRMRDGRIK